MTRKNMKCHICYFRKMSDEQNKLLRTLTRANLTKIVLSLGEMPCLTEHNIKEVIYQYELNIIW